MTTTKNELSVKKVLDEIHQATTELLGLISSFNEEQFNTVPFPGSWTPGQVAAHLFKSDTEMIKTLYGSTKTTERDPGEKIDEIRNTFLDFTTKLNSPGELAPAAAIYAKETLISALRESRAQISEAILTLNLSVTCTDPRLGEMTRWEIIHFIIFHTKRHAHQLKNIHGVVAVRC
jgi:hypothetical protein